MSSQLIPVEPEYVYVVIPAEYICVYHRILAMLADYGEEMLKDCKAACKDRNSGVIECFNLFNAAVAAKKLGKDKLAETLIKYIKAKINQIYKSYDNSTSFVFPIDDDGHIKAFVSCGERPLFQINPEDGELYEHKFNNGFSEHFALGDEDRPDENEDSNTPPVEGLRVTLTPYYENVNGTDRACANLTITYNGEEVNIEDTSYSYYFDDKLVRRFNDVTNISTGVHNFTVVIIYKDTTAVASKDLVYERKSN